MNSLPLAACVLATFMGPNGFVSGEDLASMVNAGMPFSLMLRAACPEANDVEVNANAEIRVEEKSPVSFPIVLKQNDSQLSSSFLISDAVSLPPQAQHSINFLSLNNVATIVDLSNKCFVVLFPGVNGYVKMISPKIDEAIEQLQQGQMRRIPLGEAVYKEVSCRKVQLMDDPSARDVKVTMWERLGGSEMPLKIELVRADVTMTLELEKVSRSKSDVALVPEGFRRYPTVTAMLQSVVHNARAEDVSLTNDAASEHLNQ